jgi:hypothetical protein
MVNPTHDRQENRRKSLTAFGVITFEHRPVGSLRHTDNDEADKTYLRDVGIQLDIDSVARLRIFIWLIHPVVLYCVESHPITGHKGPEGE